MGQVGIPAQGGSAGAGGADATLGQVPGVPAQAPADAQQAVVAQANAAADQVKTYEAGPSGGAANLRFAGMKSQAQGVQLSAQHRQGVAQRLGVISEQGQIIHIAQVGTHPRQASQVMVDGVEVEIGQELAGEVADRQAPGPLQRR